VLHPLVAYEGVLVSELLKRAGAPSGPELRGPAVAAYVVATGNDGPLERVRAL